MTEKKLKETLVQSGIDARQAAKVISVWPRWDDGEYLETDFVGPRPARPPHKPDESINESQ